MKRAIGVGFLLAILSVHAWATDVPKTISYSGKYVHADSSPMPDGVYDLLFSLYETQTGGAPVWRELHRQADKNGVVVSKGKFSAILGNQNDLPAFNQNYWVAISNPQTSQELVAREQLASTPYSLNGVPKGAIIIWRGSTCPLGYKRVGEFDNLFLRGAATYGDRGGEEIHTHNLQSGGGSFS